jgi:thiosulfate/3-mercaptopyruvate sulfurtransferase
MRSDLLQEAVMTHVGFERPASETPIRDRRHIMEFRRRFLFAVFAFAMVAGLSLSPVALAQDAATDGYAHPEWLADTAWLQEHLDDADLAVVALTPEEDFLAGHVPGAAQVDWPTFEIVETTDDSIASWQSEVESLLTGLGIDRDDTVVVYDGGTFISPRLWWILHQLGHEDVRVLNGGLEAWIADDGALETGESQVEPAAEPYAGEPNEEALVQIGEAVDALEQGNATFIDARRFEDEYAVGHIPGAINVPFMANAEPEGPKYFKSADELRSMYEEAGITPDQEIIAYCATGVRSSVTYFALLQLGYDDVSVFTGSFGEWSSDPDRPVTVGEAP